MDNFTSGTRLKVFDAYHDYCCTEGCLERATDAHHAIANSKVNRKKFPLFMQSVFNLRPVCRYHHEHYTEYPELRISESLAEVYEQALTERHTDD